jgi:hypothetical protein
MQNQNNERLLEILADIRNWMRVAVREPVKAALEKALPDAKSRLAYQMFDGSSSVEQIRVACKMSPNAVVALSSRCISLGLMELNREKKRVKLFDLNDFDLVPNASKSGVGE